MVAKKTTTKTIKSKKPAGTTKPNNDVEASLLDMLRKNNEMMTAMQEEIKSLREASNDTSNNLPKEQQKINDIEVGKHLENSIEIYKIFYDENLAEDWMRSKVNYAVLNVATTKHFSSKERAMSIALSKCGLTYQVSEQYDQQGEKMERVQTNFKIGSVFITRENLERLQQLGKII